MTAAHTAREVRRRIAVKWSNPSQAMTTPEHLVLAEVTVPDGSVPSYIDRHGNEKRFGSRRIDVLAIGMWAKTGYLTQGFEVKISRSDLLVELADPTKAAAGMAICDRWWLALADAALLHDSDPVPDSWGIVACRGRGLTIVRDAKPLSCPSWSPQVTASVLAASLRAHGLCRGLAAVDTATRMSRDSAKRDKSYRAARDRAFELGVEEGRRLAVSELAS